jgi:hypothetical protein
MITRCVYAIVAIGLFSLNGANGQAADGISLGQNDTVRTLDALSALAVRQSPDVQAAPVGGNPLWGVPISALNATQDRPVFSPSRRPPAPPAAAEPVAETPAPPPPPAEPEHPLLTLVGTVIGERQTIAIVVDQTTKNLVRLHVGEAVSGWLLRSVDSRAMTVEKDSQTVTLGLPAPDSAPASLSAVSEALQANREF